MNRAATALLVLFAVAALASVFIFIRHTLKPPPPPVWTPPTASSAPPLEAYESVMDKALEGYNSGAPTALFANFARTATPAPTEQVHRDLFEGYYKAEFGRIERRQYIASASELLPDRARLVWAATFSKFPQVRVSANFVTESAQPKIVQIRFEKLEPAE